MKQQTKQSIVDWKKVWSIYATLGIPLLYLYNILLAYQYGNTMRISPRLGILGLLLAVCGAGIWIVSYVNLGFSFGVLPQKQKKVTRGLYAYINHPMYVGIWCTFVGLSIANASLPGLLFLTLIITPLLTIRAHFEEKKLS